MSENKTSNKTRGVPGNDINHYGQRKSPPVEKVISSSLHQLIQHQR
jgi:hypothetical protein